MARLSTRLQLVALYLSAIRMLEAVVIAVTNTGAAARAFSIALWPFGVAWIATALGLRTARVRTALVLGTITVVSAPFVRSRGRVWARPP